MTDADAVTTDVATTDSETATVGAVSSAASQTESATADAPATDATITDLLEGDAASVDATTTDATITDLPESDAASADAAIADATVDTTDAPDETTDAPDETEGAEGAAAAKTESPKTAAKTTSRRSRAKTATASDAESDTAKADTAKPDTAKPDPAKKAGPAKRTVPANKGGRNSEPQALTKPEKRALAKQAAAKRAAAARRRRIGGYLVTAVLILGIIAAVFIGLNWKDKKSSTPGANGSATPSAGAQTPAVAFPPVPEGADPALKTKPVVKAGTGTVPKLVVTPIIQGTGPATQNGQTLTVNYVGVKYASGEEFDSSWKRSQAFDFQLGGQVIQGWNQGLVGVKVGSRVQLDIPGSLAYGDKDDGSGSPFGPLRFVVDVLAAK